MKRVGCLILIAISLAACSITPEQLLFLPTRTPIPPPTEYMTPTITPTFTATLPTPTFTLTPTLIGFKTATQTETPTPPPPTNTPGTPFTSTPPLQAEGFVVVSASASQFYVSGCAPSTITFMAQMKNWDVAFVELFVRFKSKESGNVSAWTRRGLQGLGNGRFMYELFPQEMKGFGSFNNPWVQYQLVSTDGDGAELGRTPVYAENITLITEPMECTPTPSPTATPTSYFIETPTSTP